MTEPNPAIPGQAPVPDTRNAPLSPTVPPRPMSGLAVALQWLLVTGVSAVTLLIAWYFFT